ncbi:MAG TPA: ABC transporter permease subunit [Polyangia bacterium]|nr:ABC transporter permease subunit [Polyangia bacterium]
MERPRRRADPFIPWVIPLLALAAWQVIGGRASPGHALTTPGAIAAAAVRLTASGELAHHAWVSLQRALLGLAIGGGAGLLLGLANGHWRLAERLLDTPVQMIRNVPHLALIPLVILWFGLGEGAKVLLVALGVLFPVYVNTLHGVRSIDPGLLEMGRSYGLGPGALFRQLLLPGALPSILVGFRFALGVMWLSLIVAETIATDSGIGYLAMNAREFMQTDVVMLSVLLYALLGKAADVCARAVERAVIRWDPRFSADAARGRP